MSRRGALGQGALQHCGGLRRLVERCPGAGVWQGGLAAGVARRPAVAVSCEEAFVQPLGAGARVI